VEGAAYVPSEEMKKFTADREAGWRGEEEKRRAETIRAFPYGLH